MGIRAKGFLVLFLLIVASVAAVDVYISLVLERRLTESVSRDLRIRLELVRSQLERDNVAGNDAGAWKKAIDRLGEQAQARITMVQRDGTVIADSEVPSGEGSQRDWSTNPEIAQALQGAEGFSVRDRKDGQRVSYVALPFRQGGQVIGAVRAAEPLAAVEDAVAGVHRTLLS